MRSLTPLVLGAVLLTPTPDPAYSQLLTEQDAVAASFVPGARSPGAAKVLEIYIPTAGFAYGGNWRRGLLPNAVRIGGLYLAVAAIFRDSDLLFGGNDLKCQTECKAGFVLGVLGTGWAVKGAVDVTNEFNDRLRAAVALNPHSLAARSPPISLALEDHIGRRPMASKLVPGAFPILGHCSLKVAYGTSVVPLHDFSDRVCAAGLTRS